MRRLIQTLVLAALFASFQVALARTPFQLTLARNGSTHLQALTGDDSDVDRVHWDKLYRENRGYVFGIKPVEFLVESMPHLPKSLPGEPKLRALDVAMGEGRNAVYLARNGFAVEGVDISKAAIVKAQRMARESGVHIKAITADLNSYKIEKEAYSVIVICYFLQRNQAQAVIDGLKPGGMLVFETNTVDDLKYNPKKNPRDLLRKGEIKTLFKGLETVELREIDTGTEAFASLLARKPLK